MNILFIGVFDTDRKSTNTSQLLAFSRTGHKVVGYNYRQKAKEIGFVNRDEDIISVVEKGNYDLVVYSKCNVISERVFTENKKHTKTCLWFMDAMVNYDAEMRKKTSLVSYFCCDKQNVLEEALKINKMSFHICEGFDEDIEKPHDIEKEYNVSFIGNIYGDRAKILKNLDFDIKVINNAYGSKHSLEVSKSRINLNLCTDNGASDRVYKIMAAGGFLLSNNWINRKKHLTNGKDCVIFDTMKDLNEKIEYYLKNEAERNRIAQSGREAVQMFNRLNWAEKIVEYSYGK